MKAQIDLGIHTKITFPLFFEKLYAENSVKDACLLLRDKYQLNVNVLLLCCWLANNNYCSLADADIQNVLAKTMPWQEKIIGPLRALYKTISKNGLNNSFKPLCQLISENEAVAEKIEQALIVQAIGKLKRENNPKESQVNRALSNIFNYFKTQHINLHKIDLEKIYRIVTSCFDDQ